MIGWNSAIDSHRGGTLIELMVVCSIVVLAAVSLSIGLMRLSIIEDESRDMAFIRERMCRMLSQYAECLSIATSVESSGSDCYEIEYRGETGGISLETNFMRKVTSVRLSPCDLYATSALSDKRATGVDMMIMSEDEKYINNPRHVMLDAESEIFQDFRLSQKRRFGNIGDIHRLRIEGNPSNSVRRLTLIAKYPRLRKINGAAIYEDEEVAVSRIVRLWNHQ